VLEDVGRNLRRIRRVRDLTQGQVARFVGNGTLLTADNGLTPTSRPVVASIAIVAIRANPAIAITQHLRTHAPLSLQ
jgi:hypothetical protein